jgi:hypothetical protein
MMSILLTNTIAAFQEWRNNKSSRGAVTPEQLRRQALALLPHHSISTIVKDLGISSDQLKNWRLVLEEPTENRRFVSLPSHQREHVGTHIQTLSFDVNLNNGNTFSVSGVFDHKSISSLIEAIKS